MGPKMWDALEEERSRFGLSCESTCLCCRKMGNVGRRTGKEEPGLSSVMSKGNRAVAGDIPKP